MFGAIVSILQGRDSPLPDQEEIAGSADCGSLHKGGMNNALINEGNFDWNSREYGKRKREKKNLVQDMVFRE